MPSNSYLFYTVIGTIDPRGIINDRYTKSFVNLVTIDFYLSHQCVHEGM